MKIKHWKMAKWHYLLCKKRFMGGYIPVKIYTALDTALGDLDDAHVIFRQRADGKLERHTKKVTK